MKTKNFKQMKRTILILLAIIPLTSFGQPNADEIIDRVDRNMSADNQVVESQMIIHGRRASRTITSVSYTVGDEKSFTEYLSPPREQGTKMLKLEDQLWIYSPSTDRTIQISGHMLRQSVMGSDLSYEDLMNDRKLTDVYSARVTGSEEIDGRDTWVLQLEATVSDIAYASRRVWIDKEKYVPLKEELYAKSGQLLKRSSMSDIRKVDGRWYPMTIVYKDVLKQGDGTEFKVIDIKFNQDIPDYMFSKAALKQ